MKENDVLKEVENKLKEKGVRISIGGCGCCGSPWVTIEIDGEKVVSDENEFNIDMFSEKQNPGQ